MKANKPLRISILTTSFPVYEGIAVGVHVYEQAKHLQDLGHEVSLIAPGHQKAPTAEVYRGIKTYRFNYFFPKSLQKLAYGDGIPTNLRKSFLAKIQLPFFLLSFLLKGLQKSWNADIIHCHWSIAGLVGVMAGKIRKKKIVLSMHGAEIFVLGKNRLLSYVLKNTDLVINNSNYTQEEVLKHYPTTKCLVISPGTDTNRFKPSASQNLREELQLTNEDFFLLSIGKFIPRKGFEYLIDAMNLLINEKNLRNIQLRLGGRGYLKESYQEKIKSLKLESNIKFLDYLEDSDIPAYYTEADLFVLPSIVDDNGDTEGLGVVLIEANACECPVIASAVGGITDVIIDGKNGLLVEPKNARMLAEKIDHLYRDKSLRLAMGIEGRKRVEDAFSWKKNAERMSDEYYKLLTEI